MSSWTFLTKHAHVLLCMAQDPDAPRRRQRFTSGNRYRRVAAALFALSLAGCTTLPTAPLATHTEALPPEGTGVLAQISKQLEPALSGNGSAFTLIPSNREAMNWRLALIDSAVGSIDAQYFIWKDDEASSLLLEHIFAAADRGVRVRLLVDDMFLSTGGVFSSADAAIAALDFHPKVTVRLFNPGKFRNGLLGLTGNFGSNAREYNRRMHNKLLIADNHLAIVGGRNIGNEYFGLYESYNFLDLDVLFAGAVVEQASAAFDDYWNADLAYPGGALTEVDQSDYEEVRQLTRDYIDDHLDVLEAYPAAPVDWSERLQALPARMHTGYAVFLQDEPVQRGEEQLRLYDILDFMVVPGDEEFLTVTPYLIPVGDFLEVLTADHAAGRKVRLLTTSLGSNNHTSAHSHYRKYRKRILATGAELYEFRREPEAALRRYADVAPRRGEFVSLHVKAGVVDRQKCFIGSLNLDPRAVLINTENGIYVESSGLCAELHEFLSRLLKPDNAWRVSQDDRGRLTWTSSEGTVTRQPAGSFGQRIADFFFGIIPIESQL